MQTGIATTETRMVWSGVGARSAWIDAKCDIHAEEQQPDLRWNTKTGKLQQRWWVGAPGGDNRFEWRDVPQGAD